MSAPLCDPCAAASDKWLDTKPSTLMPQLSIAYGSGAAYDASPAGIAERRRQRADDYYRKVREARAFIVELCRAGRCSTRAVDT